MKAKLKLYHPKSKPSTSTFNYDVLGSGNIQVQMSEKQFAIISKSDFDAEYEAITEEAPTP